MVMGRRWLPAGWAAHLQVRVDAPQVVLLQLRPDVLRDQIDCHHIVAPVCREEGQQASGHSTQGAMQPCDKAGKQAADMPACLQVEPMPKRQQATAAAAGPMTRPPLTQRRSGARG